MGTIFGFACLILYILAIFFEQRGNTSYKIIKETISEDGRKTQTIRSNYHPDFDFGRDYYFQSDCVIDYENEEISIQTRPYMGDYVTRYFEITDEKPRFNKIVRANL